MKKKKNYILSILFFLLLIFLTYFLILKNYQFEEVWNTIKKCNPMFISLAFLCLFLYLFFESLFLKKILNHLGHKITFRQSLGYVFTEIYFSAITPSSMGGQPVQMYEMKKDHIGYQVTSVVVLLNTMIYKIALILLATIAFVCYHKILFTTNSFFNWVVLIGYVTTILVIILFGVLVYSKTIVKWFQKLIRWFVNHLHFLKKKNEKLKKLEQTVKEYQQCAIFTKKHPYILIESFAILFLQRLSILSISYFVYRAFGLNSYTISQLIAFQICITLGSDLMPTPGGVMINEGLSLSANTFLYGEGLALSSMLLTRSISFYFLVILSATGYIIFCLRKRKEVKK